jgi:hypothetical protein
MRTRRDVTRPSNLKRVLQAPVLFPFVEDTVLCPAGIPTGQWLSLHDKVLRCTGLPAFRSTCLHLRLDTTMRERSFVYILEHCT